VNRIYNTVSHLIDDNCDSHLDDILINSVGIFEDFLLVSQIRNYPVISLKFQWCYELTSTMLISAHNFDFSSRYFTSGMRIICSS
jgi:hypothetical protein